MQIMNSIILKAGRDTLTDPTVLKHIHQTLKLNQGDIVKATVLNHGIGKAKLLKLTEEFAEFEFLEVEKKVEPWFDIIVGASRPQTMKKILEHGTTFGAQSFHIFKAHLSEKSYLDSQIYNDKDLNELTTLGLSQSALYYRLPEIQKYQYNPASKFSEQTQKFVLDPYASQSFLDVTIDFTRPIVISFGPERGFTNDDLTIFKNNGFNSIKISSSILRVEHAIYATVAQLEMLKRKY